MSEPDDLAERLRETAAHFFNNQQDVETEAVCDEAASVIEAQAARIAELEAKQAEDRADWTATILGLRADAAIGKRLREIGQSPHWSAQGAINEALAAAEHQQARS